MNMTAVPTRSTTNTSSTRASPSIGAVNPALAAMANGIRVGEHVLERVR